MAYGPTPSGIHQGVKLSSPAVLNYPKGVTIFGREPASILSGIEAVLTLIITFGVGQGLGISQEFYGPFIALVSAGVGAYIAWTTKDTGLGYYLGAVKAGVALIAVYGFTITDAQLGALLAVVTVGVGLFNRQATTPVAKPADPSPTQVVPVPPTEDVVADVKAVADAAEESVVGAGEAVGTSGSTGDATGPHLHFDVPASGEPALGDGDTGTAVWESEGGRGA